MGRVEIPTKYIFPRGLARGMVVDLWSPRRGGKRKTERGGQEMYTNIYRRNPYPAAVCLCFFRRGCPYFQYTNKVERGVKLKFSQLGASRGRGGRRRTFKRNPSFSLGLWSRNIYILGAGDLGAGVVSQWC